MPLPSNIHDLCQASISLIHEKKFSALAEKWKTVDVDTLNEEDAKQLAEYLDSKSELPDIALTAYEALLMSKDLVTEKSMPKTQEIFALGGVLVHLLPFTKKYGIRNPNVDNEFSVSDLVYLLAGQKHTWAQIFTSCIAAQLKDDITWHQLILGFKNILKMRSAHQDIDDKKDDYSDQILQQHAQKAETQAMFHLVALIQRKKASSDGDRDFILSMLSKEYVDAIDNYSCIDTLLKTFFLMDKAKKSSALSQQASKSSANKQGNHEEQKSPSTSVDSSIPPASTAAPSTPSTMAATDSPLAPGRSLSPLSISRPLLGDVFPPATTHSSVTKQRDHSPTRRLG